MGMRASLLLSIPMALSLSAGETPAVSMAGIAGSGSGDWPTTVPLIDDLGKAKELWRSIPLPDARAADASDRVFPTVSGGYFSPIIAGSRVYITYYVPAGTAAHKALVAAKGEQNGRWRILADEVVTAFDLASGKVAWSRTFPLEGLNLGFGNKGAGGSVPLVAGGRVYVNGNAGRLRCLDAASGEVRWNIPIEPRAGIVDVWRAKAVAEGKVEHQVPGRQGLVTGLLNRGNLDFPILCGDTLVIRDGDVQRLPDPSGPTGGGKWQKTEGLAGYDPATGARRWHLPDAGLGRFTNPQTVVLDGKPHVLSCGTEGAWLVDAAAGTVLWKEPGLRASMGLVGIDGDLVVSNAQETKEAGPRVSTMTGWRISTKGATKLWSKPELAGDDPITIACRKGVAWMAIAKGNATTMLGVSMADGSVVANPAKPGTGGGEHNNMFAMLHGDRLFTWVGGNSGDAGQAKPGLMMYRLGADGRSITQGGSPMTADFAWGYAMSVVPAFADGIVVVRLRDRLVAYDLRAGR